MSTDIGWAHNDDEKRWELTRYRHVICYVTDEFLERVFDPTRSAVDIFNAVGSVPPPMVPLLPDVEPEIIVYEWKQR